MSNFTGCGSQPANGGSQPALTPSTLTIEQQLLEARQSLLQALKDGVQHSSVDGVSTTILDIDKWQEVIDDLESALTPNKPNNLGIKMVALNAPAAGGR